MRPLKFATPTQKLKRQSEQRTRRQIRGKSGEVAAIRDLVLDCMEQGVIVWNADAKCRYHSRRLHVVLEHAGTELKLGMSRNNFFLQAVQRGEFSAARHDEIEAMCTRREAFTYDRYLPSGRIVATTARPLEDGGYVVTFTDVSSARKLVAELDAAKNSNRLTANKKNFFTLFSFFVMRGELK